jgi:hypothetical protein
MLGEYKRPTKIVELPSGKKVEIVTYLSRPEIDSIRAAMIKGQKIKGGKLQAMVEQAKKDGGTIDESELFAEMEFDIDVLNQASQLTRTIAVKKLIDVDGKEYEATENSLGDFLEEDDGTALDKELNELNKKKVTTEKK